MSATHLTIGEVAETFGVPAWKVRRVVDSLGFEIPRAGLYRLVPRELLAAIGTRLQEDGWLPSAAESRAEAVTA